MQIQFLKRNGRVRVVVNRLSPWKIRDNPKYDNLRELVISPFASDGASIILVVSDGDLENLKKEIDRALDRRQSPIQGNSPDGANRNQEATKSLPGQKTMFD